MTSYASTFGTVTDSVIAKLRLDAAADTDRVHEYINQTYVQVAAETRCLATNATATMTQGDNSYTMPSPVLHIQELTLNDGSGQVYPPLVEARLDRILRLRQFNVAVGPPRFYALVGMNQLEFWPAARGTDILTFWYSYLPDALSADGDVSELPEPFGSKLLEYGALVQAAEFKKDTLLEDFRAVYGYEAGPQGSHIGWFGAFQRFVNRRAGSFPAAFEVWGSNTPYGVPDRSSDWNLTGWNGPWPF